jgi:hypothetical protein
MPKFEADNPLFKKKTVANLPHGTAAAVVTINNNFAAKVIGFKADRQNTGTEATKPA